MRIAVLMTCFNRKDITLRALDALLHSKCPAPLSLQVFLVDDGSSDGTAAAISARYPAVRVIAGTGNLFWNGGMRLAWQTALEDGRHDFFLWLNDDLALQPDALGNLVELWKKDNAKYGGKLIVVGRTVSASSGETTYGGYVRAHGLSRLRFIRPNAPAAECITMNGNCVLIPAAAVQDIGINSAHYVHAYGDNDYGLRATRAGYTILQEPTPVGFQERNDAYERNLSRLTPRNWRFIFFDPKGVALREWWTFCRQHGGFVWPINFVARYLKMAAPKNEGIR